MKPYTHFTLTERLCLQEMRKEGKSFREIAKELDRSPSSVCREYNRNSSQKKNHYYNVHKATLLYNQRRKNCKRKPVIVEGSKLYKIIEGDLQKFWSPEIIANHCKNEGLSIAFTTIYAAIKNGRFADVSPKTHLRRKGKRKHSKHTNCATIHPEHTIHDRPDVVELKWRLGDWEGDTICGAKNKSCLITQVDRASRLLVAAISPNHTMVSVRAAVKKAFASLPTGFPIHTITLDNGSEFADFKGIEQDLGTTIYFADPHSPWQRGLNENTNDMLRFFFPKGTDFNLVSQAELDYVVSLINNRPRKCLGYLSPIQFISNKCCT